MWVEGWVACMVELGVACGVELGIVLRVARRVLARGGVDGEEGRARDAGAVGDDECQCGDGLAQALRV